jgi:hypothetical protein
MMFGELSLSLVRPDGIWRRTLVGAAGFECHRYSEEQFEAAFVEAAKMAVLYSVRAPG